ncbi:hypothetical protein VPH35_137629 [Triticum aestivum]|uniref:Uncharacterized protein n=1 Tax=Aegilops tauschii subsp. strangulata TaxID=200361 RepID=A0A453RXW6_AEGTS
MMPSFLTMMCAANLAESSFYHQEQLKPRHEPPADPMTSKHTTSTCGHHEAHRHQIGHPQGMFRLQRGSQSRGIPPLFHASHGLSPPSCTLLSEHSTSQTMFSVCVEVVCL